MDNTFVYADLQNILEELNNFMSHIKVETRKQYMDIVKDYLINEVLNKTSKDNYEEIFTSDKIKDFQSNFRKSIVVRSALGKLRDYFISINKLNKHYNFEYIPLKTKKLETLSVLTKKQLDIVFSDEINFRTLEEKYVTRCVCALFYSCLFEQRHIMNIRRSDILIEERRIRNIRVDENENEELLKWITLNDFTLKHIVDYVNYCNQNNIDISERFFILEGRPLDNTKFGLCFNTYNLKKCNPFEFFNLNGQLLNFSMIYYWLISSEGRAMSTIIQIVGIANEQWKKAFKLYLENYNTIYNPRSVAEVMDYDEMIIGYDIVESKYIQEIEMEDNEENIVIINNNDKSKEENRFNDCIPYSEANDICMDDIINFDSMSNQNKNNIEIKLCRLVRNTTLSSDLKVAYSDACQLCGTQIKKGRFTTYSEVHHIRPYNKTHKGDDTISNMIVLCPNCHLQFDTLYYAIHPYSRKVYCVDEDDSFHMTELFFMDGHDLDAKYLSYTWKLFRENQNYIF